MAPSKPNCKFNMDANSGHAFGILMAAVGALRPCGAPAPVNSFVRPMSRTLIKRLRWLFFYAFMKLIGVAGIVASLSLIGIALYGLFSSVQKNLQVGIVLLIPSLALLAYSIKLLRLSNVTPDDVDRWFAGARKK